MKKPSDEERTMSGVHEAIELLRCAEVNCDNVKRVPVLIDGVKMQIQQALKALGADDDPV